MKPTATAIWKKIATSERAPQHRRIEAIRFLDEDAPFALLQRLISNPKTPGRLQALCGEIYVRKIAKRQMEKERNADKP
jgi:hypothetical protein